MEYTHDNVGIDEVGTIKLSRKVYVTDPCYKIDTWCQKLLDNVSPGKYKCFISVINPCTWENRVSELHVVQETVFSKYKELEEIPYMSEPICYEIGVDSGQCGIFDAEYYERSQPNNKDWYKRICDLTCNAGTIDDLGVATCSGFGDGAYPLYVAEENGEVVAMMVKFIDFSEDESI